MVKGELYYMQTLSWGDAVEAGLNLLSSLFCSTNQNYEQTRSVSNEIQSIFRFSGVRTLRLQL